MDLLSPELRRHYRDNTCLNIVAISNIRVKSHAWVSCRKLALVPVCHIEFIIPTQLYLYDIYVVVSGACPFCFHLLINISWCPTLKQSTSGICYSTRGFLSLCLMQTQNASQFNLPAVGHSSLSEQHVCLQKHRISPFFSFLIQFVVVLVESRATFRGD